MSKTNYKQVEIEIRKLVSQGRETIWEVATRCVKLLNESDTYAVAIGIKPDDVLDHLNGYLKDFAVDLESVVTMLEIFPNKEQWNKPLLDLLGEAMEVVRQRKRADEHDSPVIQRKTATVKQLQLAEEKAISAEREAVKLKSEIDQLREENATLKQQVATLKGQVAELRRLSREPVGV